MITAVIIDDEQDARENLALILNEFCPSIKIIGLASSVVSGVKLINEVKPDLLFLDIAMPDGTGFDLLDCIKEKAFKVIFVTAYDDKAIKAFRYSAVDYLLKPIDIDVLDQSIKNLSESFFSDDDLKLLTNTYDESSINIALPTTEGLEFIDPAKILRVEAQRSYSNVHIEGEEQKVICRSLRDFESVLTEGQFYRCHKSHLINLGKVDKFVRGDGGYVIMKDGTNVELAKSKKEEFLNLIKRV